MARASPGKGRRTVIVLVFASPPLAREDGMAGGSAMQGPWIGNEEKPWAASRSRPGT